jgi:hypothetical protein
MCLNFYTSILNQYVLALFTQNKQFHKLNLPAIKFLDQNLQFHSNIHLKNCQKPRLIFEYQWYGMC